MDDGNFRLRTFGEETRTKEEVKATELDINGVLDGLDDHT